MKYKQFEKRKAIPEAISMINSFRCLGYNTESAVADIIDNSITAKAQNIWIDVEWDGNASIIVITDDGHGMSNDEIANALKPGCKGPEHERSEGDLGRFGLGLKTASFSQTRKFTVLSKTKDSEINSWTWDLDFVEETGDWTIVKYCPNTEIIDRAKQRLQEIQSGTSVIWWDLDRLCQDADKDNLKQKEKFYSRIRSVEYHLATIFHRFIMDKRINLYMSDQKVEGWDPFFAHHSKTQSRPETELLDGKIKMKGYILPHRSALSIDEQNRLSGIKGSWTEHQGFYVYRNDRLIIIGDWLNLFKRELHYDLARIQVDITSDLDNAWEIDIRKAYAKLPAAVSEKLRSLANDVRKIAQDVYRHKGKTLKPMSNHIDYQPVWSEKVLAGSRKYVLNRHHPIIESMINNSANKKEIKNALRLIEETIPIHLIQLRESSEILPVGEAFFETPKEIEAIIEELLNKLMSQDYSIDSACSYLRQIEPFDNYTAYIDTLRGRYV